MTVSATTPVQATQPPAKTWSTVPVSTVARSTVNPIRQVIERLHKLVKDHQNASDGVALSTNEPISLSIGDPTVFGNFKTHPEVNNAVRKQLDSFGANGYGPSYGLLAAREAVARHCTTPAAPLTAGDVILTSACSGALEIALMCLAEAGQNILIPRPGFSLYKMLAVARGVEVREYPLLPERNWEIDIEAFSSLVDDRTAVAIINNPSNPCGSVFTKTHLQDILAVCEARQLPVIADEIYGDMVFGTSDAAESDDEGSHDISGISPKFHPLATLTATVPILTVGGLAKQWLVPGWRIGWILIHDQRNLFSNVRQGLLDLTTTLLGPNTLIQAALPDIFQNVPASFYADTTAQLAQHARLAQRLLSQIPGLQVIVPQGAMYMMVGIHIQDFTGIRDDVEFATRLILEQRVEVLPGQCFDYPNYFRIVLAPPKDKLEEACRRIAQFCAKYYQV
ncbi:hypothetical protein IWQ60_007303 [Tieghemiomyces parasiticus]|uniref:Tyrosine aminotransferase n=1 Tax=Tieghemiomyces parasiticus TaxID=78921 RepID=A0A9W8A7R3_9FUNG|nr:hypothetical protein IWQ60_007303 [Tieghemiomyces parasiticus]